MQLVEQLQLCSLYKVNSFLIFTAALYFPLNSICHQIWWWASFMWSQEWSSVYINWLWNWTLNVEKICSFTCLLFFFFLNWAVRWESLSRLLYLEARKICNMGYYSARSFKKSTKNHPGILQQGPKYYRLIVQAFVWGFFLLCMQYS